MLSQLKSCAKIPQVIAVTCKTDVHILRGNNGNLKGRVFDVTEAVPMRELWYCTLLVLRELLIWYLLFIYEYCPFYVKVY